MPKSPGAFSLPDFETPKSPQAPLRGQSGLYKLFRVQVLSFDRVLLFAFARLTF